MARRTGIDTHAFNMTVQAVVTFRLLTEAGDTIVTEASDPIRTE
jgi:hypothetical protein